MNILRSSINKLIFLNPINIGQISETRSIKRWVAPTLRELRKRAKKLDLHNEPNPRSGFIEWNYHAELFAFGKRLNENFQLPLLQTALTQRSYILKEECRQRELGIEDSDMQMQDNSKLSEQGKNIAKNYINAYLEYSLPKVPKQGKQAILDHLLSVNTLANIGSNLGIKDLLFTAEYPPSKESLSQSFLAIIGALNDSSSTDRAFLFVRDFICTQLNQFDLINIWHIENPEEILQEICKEKSLSAPEPRLIGDCAQNTVLAAYHVGIYTNKQMIGKGFGEDISTAIKTASLDALQTFFGINDSMRPFNFQLHVESKNIKIT